MRNTCPHCRREADVDDKLQGCDVNCVHCGQAFTVPIVLMPLEPAPNLLTRFRTELVGRYPTLDAKAMLWRIGVPMAAGTLLLILLLWSLAGHRQDATSTSDPRVADAVDVKMPAFPDRSAEVSNARSRQPGGSREVMLPERHADPQQRDRRPAPQQAVPDRVPAGPAVLNTAGAWREGFENGWQPYWEEIYLHPELPHGRVYLTDHHVHSGRSAVVLEQAPGQHATALEHRFPDGFQGRLSVWLLLLDRELPPGARRDTREGSHTCFKVDDGDGEFMIIQGIKPENIEVSSRAKALRGFDQTKREPYVTRDWHELAIEITPDGTRGSLDGQPLQAHHPSLTMCRRVRLEIGWSCGGIAVWDDFQSVPNQ
ncbi:MAG: hypothetical protein GX575_28670 [Candidatus Anammoximicrobium sp.]|nr:hypothetical protein [Candidatus Anammoximicrobium sp.]